jgi:RNA-directed DNA polymerase
VLQRDIRQFFPSIDHAILRDILVRKIADDSVLWMIDRILEGGKRVVREEYDMVYFPGDTLFAVSRPRGPAYRQSDQSILGQRLSQSIRSFRQTNPALSGLC